MKSHYNTFAETEALLLAAVELPGIRIKDLAAATGIQANMLYKWKGRYSHLSPSKQDSLLLYFMRNEPERLEQAEQLKSVYIQNNKKNNTDILYLDRCSEMEG